MPTLFSEWETRFCDRCQARKPITEFAKPYVFCKQCVQRNRRLTKSFGISIVEYDTLLTTQNGVCAICRRPPAKTRLSVDHNHKTGDVRGLLCWQCNRGIGFWRDNTEHIQRALEYLLAKPFRTGTARLGRVTNKVKKRKPAKKKRAA